jgi:hypothetical protein
LALISDIHGQLPKVPKKRFIRAEIEQKANLKVPAQYKQKYLDILLKHQDAISINKFYLGRAKNFSHKIYLKDDNPVYRKQFKIPEAHQTFIEATLDEWLKLGVVKQTNSLYNSLLFCVPKKQGQGLRIVQDVRELNSHSHIDKYSMKEITECIGDIGRANSTIFFNNGPNLRILANESGRGLTTSNCFHHPWKRTICMGNLSHGTSGVSSQFSMINGGCFERH